MGGEVGVRGNRGEGGGERKQILVHILSHYSVVCNLCYNYNSKVFGHHLADLKIYEKKKQKTESSE